MKHCWLFMALVLLAGCARFQPRPISPAETAASLEDRSLADPGLREFLEKNLSQRAASWPLARWDFETLYLAALYYHPSLDVARSQWQVALGGNKTAAARPNPTVSVVPGYNISATGGLTPWFPAVNFDLPIQTAGKRGYRKTHAQQLSEAARLNIAATAWHVRGNLRASLLDLTSAQQRERLLQSQAAIEEKVVRSLEQQFQAGAVSSSELTLVRIALDKLQLDLADARQVSADARVRVADALGISVKALDGVALEYDLAAPSHNASELMLTEVRNQALQNRTDILGALAEYAASQSALQLEIAKQYPDIHLGPGYQYDQGDHKFSLSLGAELPLLNQNQGPIAEAEARRTEAAARFNALQAKVITEIDRASASYRVSQENLVTLGSLAASQKRQSEIVEAQFKAGAADQLDMLNSQIELGSNELLQLNGRVKLLQAFAALEDAVQRPLASLRPESIEQSPRAAANKEQQP
ncbi:MAG: TolC family protein [Verrucomicrobia bacterium]|nr:TolC family protein [Verrucomicrobiota bacterium]